MKFRYDFVSFLHSPCSVAALFFILSSIIIPSLKAQDNEFFTECIKPFNCGAFKNLSFPFWGENRPQYCGQTEYWLNCSRNRQFPGIIINGEEFQVHKIHQFAKPQMILSRPLNSLTGNDSCPITFNYLFFPLLNETVQTTLFRSCRESDRDSQRVRCSTNGGESMFSFFGDDNVTELKKNCPDYVEIPVQKRAIEELKSGDITLSGALAREFEVKYTAYDAYCLSCNKSGGICGTDRAVNVIFTCYCADGPHDTKCRGHVSNWKKLVIGVMAGAVISVLLASVIALVLRKGKGPIRRLGVFMTTTKSDCDIEAFIRNYGTLAPKRYNFSDVKKMTNSYKEKLGQGGYGDVYKGNLPDGQIVAVKVLKESKGNGEEFINEVASISRTCHVNIVTLVGFCLKGNKRALIYEFMPNGSLEKFIFKESSTSLDLEEEENKQKLGWEKLYHIAIGIARGLEYLHRGCNTRILHLDIKPHNILLDEEFCPKISDFGLSKLCTRKDSIVSMLEARGTIGYIAPEVFSRNFGAVSHKSDVYSYGMMVIEMVGGKKRNKVGEYFPDWVYKNLDELELQDQSATPKAEIDTGKKMILVALWCIQTIPSNRPSINRVIEMLEGSVEALPIPPQPLFSSPPRLVPNSVTTSSFNSVSLLVD